MEIRESRWFFLFVLISLISFSFYSPKAYAGSEWLKHFRKDSLVNTYKTCYAVQEDRLWMGTHGDGVVIKDGKNTRTISNRSSRSTPPIDDGLVSDYITSITIDETRERVWIGTNDGLCSCNIDGKEWVRYSEKNGLPNNMIRCLTIDKLGNLWVGTPSGIGVFDGEKWQRFTENNGLSQNSVHSIKVQGNSVWVGTVGGAVNLFKDNNWQTIAAFD